MSTGPDATPSAAAWPVVTAALLTVTAVGFLSGTRSPPEPVRAGGVAARRTAAPSATANPVPRYADVGATPRGPNATLYQGAFDRLALALPALADPVEPGDRAQALAARAARRAYDGAPPVIPHAIDQRGVPDCLACHGQGMVVAGKVAKVMSHAAYASCVQCHVVAVDPRPAAERSPRPESLFVGLAAGGGGDRAWVGAPPVMPHGTWMRQDCASCHGRAGLPGLRSTHPTRQSCNQCHAPVAELEARFPRLEVGP
jgi:cytochrome c-type protein NapB